MLKALKMKSKMNTKDKNIHFPKSETKILFLKELKTLKTLFHKIPTHLETLRMMNLNSLRKQIKKKSMKALSLMALFKIKPTLYKKLTHSRRSKNYLMP